MMASQISEHVPHSEDEAAYLFQAELFALNRLTTPTPTLADAFWSPFVLDYQGRRFGKYHIGWPLLLNLGIRINAPWLVNALLGSVTLGCIAWLCGCYYSNDAGARYLPLLTAGLGLVTPGFLFLSGSLLSHSASLFWVTLSLLALYYLVEGHRPTLFALLTGAFVGAAFITRPFAALSTGLAIGIFLLVLIARGKLNWTVLLWLVLGGLPVALLLPLFWWAVTGNPLFNAYTLVWPYDRVGFGPNIGAQGYTLHSAIFINTRLKLVTLATGLFGWPRLEQFTFYAGSFPVPASQSLGLAAAGRAVFYHFCAYFLLGLWRGRRWISPLLLRCVTRVPDTHCPRHPDFGPTFGPVAATVTRVAAGSGSWFHGLQFHLEFTAAAG